MCAYPKRHGVTAKRQSRADMTHAKGVTANMENAWEVLNHQVSLLCDGWSERREYAVRVNSHIEMRVDTITHDSLITQLANMTQPLIRRKENSGGGSGGKPGSKPPGAFQSSALLDELRSYAHGVLVEWGAPTSSALRSSVAGELRKLQHSARMQHEQDVCAASWNLGGYIRRARIILGHDSPTRAFASTVCGECGGQLRVAIDGEGSVFCAGTPTTGACGTQYTQEDVIRLAMEAG